MREKRKFPVVSSAGWYGVRERVGTAGSSGGGLEDWPVLGVDGYAAMVKFIEVGQSCIPASMLESWPSQSQQHVVNARCSAVSLLGPSCCLSLD